jgi:hypothetical protein
MNRSILKLLALTVLTACGGATSQSGPDDAPTLAGRWASSCMPQPQADGSTQYIRLIFDLSADTWALDYSTFADDACSMPLLTVDINGPYVLGGPSTAVAGAFEGEFGFESKTVTAHDPGIVGWLSSLQGCGEGAWVAGTAKDVYGVGCAALGQYPKASCSADYDVVAIVDGKLRFGARPADNNMCRPEARPTALSPMILEPMSDQAE